MQNRVKQCRNEQKIKALFHNWLLHFLLYFTVKYVIGLEMLYAIRKLCNLAKHERTICKDYFKRENPIKNFESVTYYHFKP